MFVVFTFGIDSSLFQTYLDYALYGILGLVAIGFIMGFIRGFWKEGFRLLIVGGLVIGSVLFTRQLVDLFMSMNVSGLAASAGFPSLAFNLGETPILVAVTTPYNTLYQVLEQSLLSFGFVMTAEVADLLIGLTLVILRYIVFILLAILILLFGESLAAMLYFFPFRLFIPKKWRKKMKLRLLGGLAGALKMVLVLAMFLSPFTSIVNTINSTMKRFDQDQGQVLTSATYQELMDFINAYNDSTFSQSLFQWYVSPEGLTIDTMIMDYATGQAIENYRLTLATEIGSLTEIAATLLASGAIDGSFSAIDNSLLFTEQVVTNLVSSLIGSTLILRLIPIVVVVALNSQDMQNFVDPSLINLDAVNWEEELIGFGDILKGVIRSGLITPILAGDTDPAVLLPNFFSETAKPEMTMIFQTIDQSPFLSQLIPALLYGLVQQEIANGGPGGSLGFSSFLPTVWEDYANLAIGSELSLIYDVVYDLSAAVPDFFSVAFTTPPPSELGKDRPLTRFNNGETETPPSLTTLIKNHLPIVTRIMVGDTDASGYPINNLPETGKAINSNQRSLLDSDLIIRALPQLMDNLILPPLIELGGEDFDASGLTTFTNALNSGSTAQVRINYKGEFAGMLAIIKAVVNNEDLVSLLDAEPGENVDFLALLEGNDFRRGMKQDVIPTLDRSGIISEVVPGFLKATLTGEGFSEFLDLIGLETADLNFNFSSLAREMNLIIDMIGYAANVTNVADDLANNFSEVAFDLIGLLDTIYLSDIMNLNPVTQDKSTNYPKIIKGIFTLVEDLGFDTNDLDTGISRVQATNGHDGWSTQFMDTNNNGQLDALDTVTLAGENYHLINFLKTVLDVALLDISDDLFAELNVLASGSEDLDDPNVSSLYQIFAYADRSEIIAASFGGVLDNLFGSTGGLLDDDIGTSFRNVTSWTEEGSTLIYLLKQITNFEDGLNDIDFLNSDLDLVEELLQGLAASQIFHQADGGYLFPDYLLSKLQEINDLQDYFGDPQPYQAAYDSDPGDPLTIVRQDFYAVGNTVDSKEQWFGEKVLKIDLNGDPILDTNGDDQFEYVGGEIENIIAFISELQTVPLADFTSETDSELSGDSIRTLLLTLNEAPSLRIILFNVYETIFSGPNFAVGSLSLADSNTFTFLTVDQASRRDEIEITADIFDILIDMGLDGGGDFLLENFDTSTILTVDTLLTNMHTSSLFNTFRVDRQRLGQNLTVREDLTVFEQTYEFLLTTSTLADVIYDNPKAAPLTSAQQTLFLYQDIVTIPNQLTTSGPDGWRGAEGEIQRFVDIMVAFVNLGIDDFTDFSGDTLSNIVDTPTGLASVENLLLAINASNIIYPAIPNLFATMLDTTGVQVAGVDFSLAHTHYRGNRNSPANPQIVVPNTSPFLPYQDSEILGLLDLFVQVKEVDASSYNNLSLLGYAQIDQMQFLLEDIHESNVFHLQGPDPLSTNLVDLTVFEQMVVMMMEQTRVADLIEDPLNPNPAYENQFVTKKEKAQFLVRQFETNLLVSPTMHYATQWLSNETDGEGELVRFFRIFKELKANLPAVGNLDGINVSQIAPGEISRILSALNESFLAADAVPDLIRQAFTIIQFGNYTENNENYYLSPKTYQLTDLNRYDYTTFNPEVNPIINPSLLTEGVIPQALDNFYDDTANPAAYKELGVNFNMTTYLNEGNSTKPIVDLLARSQLFGNVVTTITNPSFGQPGSRPRDPQLTYLTRSLTLFNLLKGADVTKYFAYLDTLPTDKELKVNRIESIFSNNFEVDFESERLDQYITLVSSFTGLTSASQIDTSKSADFKQLISLTYELDEMDFTIDQRAFMVSEISAGFFTDIFEDEYDDVNTNYNDPPNNGVVPPEFINFYDADPFNDIPFDFGNLNPLEANGLEGSLLYLDVIRQIGDAYFANQFYIPDNTKVTQMQLALEKMGSFVNTLVGNYTTPYGPAHFNDTHYDYSNWTLEGNSKIARLFYASQIVNNPAFADFNTIIAVRANFKNNTFPVTLSVTPYATNFVFELEGKKIGYVFA